MSSTDKYLDKALKNVGIVEQQGSGNLFKAIGDFAAKNIAPNIDKIAKGVGDFFSNPENQKMVMDAGAAIASNAMAEKSKGQSTIKQAKRMKKSGGKGLPFGPKVLQNRVKIMMALGEYRVKIGTMRQELLAKGVVSDMAAYETIRNALAEELYSQSFVNQDKKATLTYVIKKIDESLNQGLVPTI